MEEQPPKDLRDLYRIYRDYAEHEDNLVNWRLSWNLAAQGLLFTAFGLTAQKLSDACENTSPGDLKLCFLRILILAVPAVGFLISTSSALGVRAANLALDELQRKWQEDIGPKSRADDPEAWNQLPGLTGGGSPKAHKLGMFPAFTLPWIFSLAWLLLFLFSLATLHKCLEGKSPAGPTIGAAVILVSHPASDLSDPPSELLSPDTEFLRSHRSVCSPHTLRSRECVCRRC